MMLRVISIVFLFLRLLRFPLNLSAIQVIRNCYGSYTVKLVRQLVKRDYKHFKLLLDLRFLKNRIKNNDIMKFEQFPLANLQNSNAKRT